MTPESPSPSNGQLTSKLDARTLERKLARNGRLSKAEANALFELLQVVRTSEEAGFDDPYDSFDRVDAWRVTSRSYRSRFTKPSD